MAQILILVGWVSWELERSRLLTEYPFCAKLLFHGVLGGVADLNEDRIRQFSGFIQEAIHIPELLCLLKYIWRMNPHDEEYQRMLIETMNLLSKSLPVSLLIYRINNENSLQFVSEKIRNELSMSDPGEVLIVPFYSIGRRGEEIGRHRSYITFELNEDKSTFDMIVNDTRTIHWMVSPDGSEHKDSKGAVAAKFSSIPLTENFPAQLKRLFLEVYSLPRYSPRRENILNFADYLPILQDIFSTNQDPELLFGKLQIYGTCSYEPFEKIIKRKLSTNYEKDQIKRMKNDLRKQIFWEYVCARHRNLFFHPNEQYLLWNSFKKLYCQPTTTSIIPSTNQH